MQMLTAGRVPSASDWLLIDVGNTFLKWGRYAATQERGGDQASQALSSKSHLHNDGSSITSQVHRTALEHCIVQGRVLLAEIPILAIDWREQACPAMIVISSVAGTRVRNPLLRALEVWNDAPSPRWISSLDEECGVHNRYRNPGQLGSDRWAALIGARALVGSQAALVVVCGTATTMDLLDTEGNFEGGSIMPGLGLMQRSLHERTAALPDATGEYLQYPRQTVDAIASGCLHAQAGAVERVFRQYNDEHPKLICVLSGGAARMLSPRLEIAHRLIDNLVLEGLFHIARQMAAKQSKT